MSAAARNAVKAIHRRIDRARASCFTTPDGAALHPDWITRRFRRLVDLSGLPPVRLHDLRHGAATLAHAAGADLKTVLEQLGHTSIVLTAAGAGGSERAAGRRRSGAGRGRGGRGRRRRTGLRDVP